MGYEAEFGFILQKLRLEKNLSQAELAKMSRVDRTFISLLERGIRQPSLTTLIQLASALDIKPSALVLEVEKLIRRSRWRRLKR